MERRKNPNENRYGQLVRFIDAIQEMVDFCYSDDIINKTKSDELDYLDFTYNPKVIDKIRNIAKEIRCFDITEIKSLYLTSGGRIVLDHGYGESFNDSDTVLFTREELKRGIRPDKFVKRINEVLEERK